MTHEKLVAGTTSPTRYTKIIRFPGEGTKYNRTYQETDYVSRYTKTVAGGKDYVPPAPPSDPLEVADGQGANWVGSNVYEIGQTVEARTAAFTGGVEPVTYRYRFQTKAVGSDTWVNQAWTNTTNAKNPVFYNITAPGQLKFQSQARDSSDPTVQLNSVTGIKTVAQTTIGTVTATIDGAPYDIAVGAPVTVMSGDSVVLATSISGDASPSYTWTVKSGSASFTGTGSTVTALIDTVPPGQVQIQCDIVDTNASDNPFSFRYGFLIGE